MFGIASSSVNNNRAINTVTINSSGTNSTNVSLSGSNIIGLIVPGMTGTSLTLQGSIDGVNFIDIYNVNGAIYQVAIGAQPRFIAIDGRDLLSCPYIKLISNAIEVAERSITIISRGF